MLAVNMLSATLLSNWRSIIAGAVLIGAFGAGWTINGWRKDADIATIQKEQAEAIAKNASAAAEEYATRANDIHESAMMFQKSQAEFSAKIAKISKDLKNAPRLPDSCKPDTVRVRSLSEAIDATNSAVGQ